MITPEQYKNIGGVELSNQSYPTYFIPSVTKNDYSKGYIYRYLVQKINDLTITEVNKDKYNEIYSQYYYKIVIQWIVSGPKNNQYNNKILERKGVQEQNIQTLNDGEKSMKGLKTYLNNPLEFWGGK
jgi:hypothetical protein